MKSTAARLLDDRPLDYFALPVGNPCARKRTRSRLLDDSVVVVGHSGCGKSEALGNLLRHVAVDPGFTLLRAHPSQFPNSPLLAEIAPGLGGTATFWQQYWRTVILATAYSFMCSSVAPEGLDQDELEAISLLASERPSRLLPPTSSAPRHAFTVFRQIGHLIRALPDRRSYTDDPRWDEIEERIVGLMAGQKPLVIAIDELDDWRDQKPQDYSELQIGLVREVARISQHPGLGRGIRVLTSLDAHLYDRLQRERPTKFTENFVRLSWDSQSLHDFANELIADQLRYGLRLLSPEALDPLERICGLAAIEVPERAVTEETWSYALRHGAGNPRTLVALVNDLGDLAGHAHRSGLAQVDPRRLKVAIQRYASASGWELLNECASRLLAGTQGADLTSTPGLGQALGTSGDRVVVDLLRAWVSTRQTDVCAVADVLNAAPFPLQLPPHEFVEMLWSSRLIGAGHIDDGGRSIAVQFCADVPSPPFPPDAKLVVFHSSLIELAYLRPEACELRVTFGQVA